MLFNVVNVKCIIKDFSPQLTAPLKNKLGIEMTPPQNSIEFLHVLLLKTHKKGGQNARL